MLGEVIVRLKRLSHVGWGSRMLIMAELSAHVRKKYDATQMLTFFMCMIRSVCRFRCFATKLKHFPQSSTLQT